MVGGLGAIINFKTELYELYILERREDFLKLKYPKMFYLHDF